MLQMRELRATCTGSKAYAICFALASRTFFSGCFLSPGPGRAFARQSNTQVLSCQFDSFEKIQTSSVPSLGLRDMINESIMS